MRKDVLSSVLKTEANNKAAKYKRIKFHSICVFNTLGAEKKREREREEVSTNCQFNI